MLDLDAGKYAFFVWGSFAITGLTFAAMIILSLNHARRWKKRLEALTRK